jgi:hypothetical protein
MIDVANALLDAHPEPKRDQWGRYIIPHPETGTEQPWIRATTWASSVAETFGISKWEQRLVAVGLARRPDLLAQVATVTDPDSKDGKKLLNRLVVDAHEFAGSATGRNNGSALHSFAEHVDLGRSVVIPAPYDADIAAYTTEMAAHGATIDPAHVEQIVVVPDLGVAGTFDRLVTLPGGPLQVFDLKTGKDLSYAWTEIAIQLAIYAHAATIWDQTASRHIPMPPVDLERALVMHVPVGKATATLYQVDIAAGWEMAQTCGVVRAWRARKNLANPIPAVTPTTAPADLLATAQATPAAPVHDLLSLPDSATVSPDITGVFAAPSPVIAADEPVPPPVASAAPSTTPERRAWLVARVTAIVADPRQARQLADAWPADVPTLRDYPGHTDLEVDRIAEACWTVETANRLEFPQPDPNHPTEQPVIAGDDPTILEIVERIGELPGDLVATVQAGVAEANIPRLTGGRATATHVAAVDDLVTVAEIDLAERLGDLRALHGLIADPTGIVDVALIRTAAGTTPLDRFTQVDVDRFAAVIDAYHTGFLTVIAGETAPAAGLGDRLASTFGDKRKALSAAKATAKAHGLAVPSKFDDVIAELLLVALTISDLDGDSTTAVA